MKHGLDYSDASLKFSSANLCTTGALQIGQHSKKKKSTVSARSRVLKFDCSRFTLLWTETNASFLGAPKVQRRYTHNTLWNQEQTRDGELALELSLQQQKKKMSNPNTGYAFRKPSDLLNSIEWRSYYAKLLDNKVYSRSGVASKMHDRQCKASAGFSIKNRKYDQMLFNDCVIDISAPYPFGLVHLQKDYQRRLPWVRLLQSKSRRCKETNWLKTPIKVGKQTEMLPPNLIRAHTPDGGKVHVQDVNYKTQNGVGASFLHLLSCVTSPMLQRRFDSTQTRCKVNDNQFLEQTQVTSPFFQNFKGVQKNNFFTNYKIMMRPFIMDEQFPKVGMGSFVTRTQIPILDCALHRFSPSADANNQPMLPVDPPLYKAIANSFDVVQSSMGKKHCTLASFAVPCISRFKEKQTTVSGQLRKKNGRLQCTSVSDCIKELTSKAGGVKSEVTFATHPQMQQATWFTSIDEQGRQKMNVHSLLSSHSLCTEGAHTNLPAAPLESLYNKFHTLPIFSTFIYKEWSHRFSFLEYFIWSARKNDLGLPFYNRRGACHTTRVNSINLIRNQIGAQGMCVAKEQFLFGFNGCTRNIFWNERSQKAQLEQFVSLDKKNSYLPFSALSEVAAERSAAKTERCNIENLTQIEQATSDVSLPVASSSYNIKDLIPKGLHYLVSKNALQVIELRDKSSCTKRDPALSVQSVSLKKAFFSSRFSVFNFYGCSESEVSKTQQANSQHERFWLFSEMEDTNEKIEQFESNNGAASRAGQGAQVTGALHDANREGHLGALHDASTKDSEQEKRTKRDLGNGYKVHKKEAFFLKKKVGASSIFRQIDKFFGWQSYAHVAFLHAPPMSFAEGNLAQCTYTEGVRSDCIKELTSKAGGVKSEVHDVSLNAPLGSEFAPSVSCISDAHDEMSVSLGCISSAPKVVPLREGEERVSDCKVDQTYLETSRSDSFSAAISNSMLRPRFDHSMQSATLFSIISNDNRPSSCTLLQSKNYDAHASSYNIKDVTQVQRGAKNSAEMWGKVDDTQQFPRLAELLHFTGGTALRHLLSRFNLVLLGKFIRHELKNLELKVNFLLALKMLTYSQGLLLGKLAKRRSKQIRRLKLLELFQSKKSNPEWMILSVLPVLPPDLRPILRVNDDFVVASDLNRLYQTVLRRNNTIHERLDDPLPCPESGLFRQRSLQKAVDGLLENGKGGGTPLCASKRRPLVSLSHVLKGKKGLFRQHLLGKRVDYSGRSVIVVGPKLNLHECGLPKEMALELFQPFLIHRLKVKGLATSNTTARRMIQQEDPIIWHTVKQLVYEHPVLLNRAPTLHRLGIQAFQPRLVSGRAILLHPLVCNGFNADFDGDQMAVHVPLSFQARAEAWKIMWSKNNLLSPATGQPILVPSQDMVLGCYYLSVLVPRVGSFKGADETLPVRASSMSFYNSCTGIRAPEVQEVNSKEGATSELDTVPRRSKEDSAPKGQRRFDTKPPKNDYEHILFNSQSELEFNSQSELDINEVAKINFSNRRFEQFSSKPIYFPGYFKKTQHLGFLTDTNFAITSSSSSNSYASLLSQLVEPKATPFKWLKNNTGSGCTEGAKNLQPPVRFTGNASSLPLRGTHNSFFEPSFLHSRSEFDLSLTKEKLDIGFAQLNRLIPAPRITKKKGFDIRFSTMHNAPFSNIRTDEMHHVTQRCKDVSHASEMQTLVHCGDNSKSVKNSAYHLKRGHYFSSLQDSLMAYSQGRLQTHTPFWVRLDYSVADVKKNGTISPLVCASSDVRFSTSDVSHVTLARTSAPLHRRCIVHRSETSCNTKGVKGVLQTQVHCWDNSKSPISIKNENYRPLVLLKTAVVPSSKKKISQLLCDNTCTRVSDLQCTSGSDCIKELTSEAGGVKSEVTFAPKVSTSLAPSSHPLCIKDTPHNRRIKVQPHHVTLFHSQSGLDMVSLLHSRSELRAEKKSFNDSLNPGFDGKQTTVSGKKREAPKVQGVGESSWCKSATNDIKISSLVTNHMVHGASSQPLCKDAILQPQYGRSQELSKVLIASSVHKKDQHRCVIEGNDTLEAPLELRLAADGNLVKISTTFQTQYNCNATILDQYKERSIRYMRTTAGRVVINDKIVHLVNRNVF